MAVTLTNTPARISSPSATSHSPSLGFTPTAGRTLVVGFYHQSSSATFTSIDPDWTLIDDNTNATRVHGCGWAYRISDGTETNFSLDVSSSQTVVFVFLELDGLASSAVLDQFAESTANQNSTNATTCLTGTTGTLSVSNGYALEFFSCDGQTGWDTGRSYTNGSTELFTDLAVGGTSTPGCFFAYKVLSSTTGFGETVTTTDSGDGIYGSVAVFKQAAAGSPFEVEQTSAVSTSGTVTVGGDLAYVAPFAVDPADLPIAGAISVAGNLAYTAPFSLDPAALPVTGTITVAGDLAFSTAITLQLNPSPLAISASITVAGDLAPYPFLELVPSPLPITAQVTLSADLQYSIGFILSSSALPVTVTAAVAGDLQYSTAPPPTPPGGWGAGASGGGGRGLRELTAKIGKDAEDLLERKRKARHEPAPESPQRQAPARVAEAGPVARPAGRTDRDEGQPAKPAVPGPREQELLDLRALERRVQKLEEMILEDRRRREEEAEEEAVVKLLLG